MESPVPRKLTVMCIANRPKRHQIKLFSRKSTIIRRVLDVSECLIEATIARVQIRSAILAWLH